MNNLENKDILPDDILSAIDYILEKQPNAIFGGSIALNAVGLDVGAVDVKVQSKTTPKDKTRKTIEFIVLEINSAPSFGSITAEKYIQEIPKILKSKYGSSIH